MIIAGVIIGICILLMEILLWQVFNRKVEGITFPSEADHSHFRFFNLIRIRLIAIVHTAFLLSTLILSAIYLW